MALMTISMIPLGLLERAIRWSSVGLGINAVGIKIITIYSKLIFNGIIEVLKIVYICSSRICNLL
jgi:hypothetical protein